VGPETEDLPEGGYQYMVCVEIISARRVNAPLPFDIVRICPLLKHDKCENRSALHTEREKQGVIYVVKITMFAALASERSARRHIIVLACTLDTSRDSAAADWNLATPRRLSLSCPLGPKNTKTNPSKQTSHHIEHQGGYRADLYWSEDV